MVGLEIGIPVMGQGIDTRTASVRRKRPPLLWIGTGILYLSLVPHLLRIGDPPHGDVGLYFNTITTLFEGNIPYHLERPFEYPPYALLCFVLPSLGGSLEDFRFLFALQLLAVDTGLKWWLLNEGLRLSSSCRALLPLSVYSLGTGFLSFHYLQRIDLIPSVLVVGSFVALVRGRPLLSGCLMGMSAGIKLFPILLLPGLIAACRNTKERHQLVAGGCMAALPIALMSPWVSWWRFLEFHNARGFEVESIYAAAFWLAHYFVELDLQWSWVVQWFEVAGSSIQWLLPHAKLLCFTATMSSVGWVSYRLSRAPQSQITIAVCCWSGLVVLLPFVGFNIVFSPQYMIWLLVISSALFVSPRKSILSRGYSSPLSTVVFILAAAIAVPIWYPSPEFGTGFTVFQSTTLLVRDIAILIAWILLLPNVSDLESKIEPEGIGE